MNLVKISSIRNDINYTVGDFRILTVEDIGKKAGVRAHTIRDMARFYGATIRAERMCDGSVADHIYFSELSDGENFLKAYGLGLYEPHKRLKFVIDALGVNDSVISALRHDPALLSKLYSRNAIREIFKKAV